MLEIELYNAKKIALVYVPQHIYAVDMPGSKAKCATVSTLFKKRSVKNDCYASYQCDGNDMHEAINLWGRIRTVGAINVLVIVFLLIIVGKISYRLLSY